MGHTHKADLGYVKMTNEWEREEEPEELPAEVR